MGEFFRIGCCDLPNKKGKRWSEGAGQLRHGVGSLTLPRAWGQKDGQQRTWYSATKLTPQDLFSFTPGDTVSVPNDLYTVETN